MYRTYELTDEEKNKITRMRWDGDTHYYDVFESQEECDEEQKRLDKIESEYKKQITFSAICLYILSIPFVVSKIM